MLCLILREEPSLVFYYAFKYVRSNRKCIETRRRRRTKLFSTRHFLGRRRRRRQPDEITLPVEVFLALNHHEEEDLRRSRRTCIAYLSP